MKKPRIHDERGIAFIVEIALIAAVLTGLAFAGYTAYQASNGGKLPINLGRAVPTNVTDAHTNFGFNLVKSLYQSNNTGNIVVSPTSVSLALSMVYNGSAGSTKAAIAKTLEAQKIDIAQYNQASSDLIDSLKNPDSKVELSIANSIWVDQKFSVKPSFTSLLDKYYHAKAAKLNFDDPSAEKTINDWVRTNTKGKIPSIVDKTQGKELFLINATYFKGAWTTEFDPKATEIANFTPVSGPSVERDFMSRSDKMNYFETPELQSVSLPYGKNERLAMNIFLPNDMANFVGSLDLNAWKKYQDQYAQIKGTLRLPKFKVEYSANLMPDLTKLGMGIVFSRQADFSGIADNLAISEVMHKTYLDVNESGTEAAAVTSVGMGVTSAGPTEKSFTMNVNRPYFVAIRDTQTGEVLFAGVIQKP